MNRKNLTVAAIVGVVIVGVATVTWIVFSHSKKTVVPVITPSASPSVTPSPSPTGRDNSDGEAAGEKQIVAFNNQPIIKALPKSNAHWSLEYVSSENGKFRVRATVFVRPGQNAEAVLVTQKPYISDFLEQTGQPEDTLIVTYTTRPLESD